MKKLFLKSTISTKTFFLKSMTLTEKVFVKSVILNEFFFRVVRFRINFFTTRQNLNQLFYIASDFDSTFLQRVRF